MRSASGSLRTIAAAQADFKANDRDGNGLNDYWRGDLSGLYTIQNHGEPIKLIELSIAAADDRSTTDVSPYTVKSPKTGFWYRALPHDGESTPSPDRFAASCHPESLVEGRYGTYVIDERNTVLKKMLGHANGIDAFPSDERLEREAWETLK